MLARARLIPFVLLGTPSCDPWWFDDVETIQAQCMNLDSLNIENHVKTTYPQLVLAAGGIDRLSAQLIEREGQSNGVATMELVKEVVRGLSAPMVEMADEKGITRYIEPESDNAKLLPDEINRKRGLLFDMVGLSLFNKETRQIQTAEAKQFDQLDTESTLQHRSIFMQESEKRLVSRSKLIDPEFKEYDPVWPMTFDVIDLDGDMKTVVELANMPDLTPAMKRLMLVVTLRILEKLGGRNDDLLKEATEEIDKMTFDNGAIIDQ